MSHITEQKLLEFATWYNYNKTGIVDLQKKTEFLDKAIENLALVMVNFAEDVKVIEGRGRLTNTSEIILPSNCLLKKTMRKEKVNGRSR